MLRLLVCLVLICIPYLALTQSMPIPAVRPAELEPGHAQRLMTRLALRYGKDVMPYVPFAQRTDAENQLIDLLEQVEVRARYIPLWVVDLPKPNNFLSILSLTQCGQFAAAIPSTRPPQISWIGCLTEQQGASQTIQPFYVTQQNSTHVVGYVLQPKGTKRVVRVALPGSSHAKNKQR